MHRMMTGYKRLKTGVVLRFLECQEKRTDVETELDRRQSRETLKEQTSQQMVGGKFILESDNKFLERIKEF